MLRLAFVFRATAAGLLLAAVACATAPSTPRAASGAHAALYASARAPAHRELRLCQGTPAFNTGPVGSRNEIVEYTTHVETPAGRLIRNPTDGACLSSGFGQRPLASGGGRNHFGIDLANRAGGVVYAAGDGRISVIERRGGYGLHVKIDHGGRVSTLYGHLAEVNPRLGNGDRVAAGEPIGFMGATGNATGVHLHYEITVAGVQTDPLRR